MFLFRKRTSKRFRRRCYRSENWFVVYGRHTTVVKLTSPSMGDVTIKYKIGNR